VGYITLALQVIIALPKIFEFIGGSIKAWQEQERRAREMAHQNALKKLKEAKTEEEIREANRELAKNP
jgi:uncharacterized membrane protein (DUF106 family)